jgi:hypothetical protein
VYKVLPNIHFAHCGKTKLMAFKIPFTVGFSDQNRSREIFKRGGGETSVEMFPHQFKWRQCIYFDISMPSQRMSG